MFVNGGQFVTQGRFSITSNDSGGELIEVTSGGSWTHEHSGISNLSLGSNSVYLLYLRNGTADVTGDFDLEITAGSTAALAHIVAGKLTATGDFKLDNIANSNVTQQNLFRLASSSAELELVGSAHTVTRSRACAILVQSGFFTWRDQNVTVPENRSCYVAIYTGTLNLSGLTVDNAGSVCFAIISGGSALTEGTAIINQPGATGFASFPGIAVTNVPDNAATLPPTEKVVLGEVYGFENTPLTGSALLLDSTVLQTAISQSQPANLSLIHI